QITFVQVYAGGNTPVLMGTAHSRSFLSSIHIHDQVFASQTSDKRRVSISALVNLVESFYCVRRYQCDSITKTGCPDSESMDPWDFCSCLSPSHLFRAASISGME